MQNVLDTYVRPILARVLAALMVPLCAWMATRLGVKLSPEAQSEIVVATVSLIIYAASHKAVNVVINPTDAAKLPPRDKPPGDA